jgi:hypothetical protein
MSGNVAVTADSVSAKSYDNIYSNNAYTAFTAEEFPYQNTVMTFKLATTVGPSGAGLSSNISVSANWTNNSLTYGIYNLVAPNEFLIYYDGAAVTENMTFSTTDTFTIAATSSGVYYYQSGNLIYANDLLTSSGGLRGLFYVSTIGNLINRISVGYLPGGWTGSIVGTGLTVNPTNYEGSLYPLLSKQQNNRFEWGAYSASSASSGTITFSESFPDPPQVWVTPQISSGSAVAVVVQNVTSSSFGWLASGNVTGYINWFAVSYYVD